MSLTRWRRKCARSSICASVRLAAGVAALRRVRPSSGTVRARCRSDRAARRASGRGSAPFVGAARLRAVAVDALARADLPSAVRGRGVDHGLVARAGAREHAAAASRRRSHPARPPAGGGACGRPRSSRRRPSSPRSQIPLSSWSSQMSPRLLLGSFERGTQPWLRSQIEADGRSRTSAFSRTDRECATAVDGH